ncbi:hypothetical protein GPALN_004848 [Globodera pallida]|nr:hypothetical protein GPALN_004848 [Globodera pallida]
MGQMGPKPRGAPPLPRIGCAVPTPTGPCSTTARREGFQSVPCSDNNNNTNDSGVEEEEEDLFLGPNRPRGDGALLSFRSLTLFLLLLLSLLLSFFHTFTFRAGRALLSRNNNC